MPFITEEMYHRLPGANISDNMEKDPKKSGSISITQYPIPSMTAVFENEMINQRMEKLKEIASGCRSTLSTLNITKKPKLFVKFNSKEAEQTFAGHLAELGVLANASEAIPLKE
jgi:valyl-tRNA synthetase